MHYNKTCFKTQALSDIACSMNHTVYGSVMAQALLFQLADFRQLELV